MPLAERVPVHHQSLHRATAASEKEQERENNLINAVLVLNGQCCTRNAELSFIIYDSKMATRSPSLWSPQNSRAARKGENLTNK